MTNDIVFAPMRLTIAEARECLRERLKDPDFVYLIFIVDDEETRRQRGVVPLRDLLTRSDQKTLGEIMDIRVPKLTPLQRADKAAFQVIESQLAALPVVGRDERLIGAVTVDAAVLQVAPESLGSQARDILMSSTAKPEELEVQEGGEPLPLPTGEDLRNSIRITIRGRSVRLRGIRRIPPGLLGWLLILGPGLIATSAGNDAGGIATYSSAGAKYGYDLIWVMVIITVSLAVVQEMCARLGAATGRGLLDLIRERFGVGWALFCNSCHFNSKRRSDNF